MHRFWSIICCIFALVPLIIINGGKASAEIMEIVAEGSYVAGDGPDENFTVAKDRARLEAKRIAAEQAGVYIESYSEINNMRLTKDEIHTITANVLKIKSEEFLISTQDNKYIVFTCRIVCDVDTDNIGLKQLKQVNDLHAEISALRKELSMMQQLIGSMNDKKKVDVPLGIGKDAVLSNDNQEEKNVETNYVIPPKENYENHEFKDEGLKKEINSFSQQSVHNVPKIEHDGEGLVVSFSNEARGGKKSDFVKKPKGYKNPTSQSDMFSTGLIPNPQKWEFMLYSSKLPHNQPVWYDPTSIKIIKHGDTLKVLCDIMSYRAFYSNSDRWIHNIYQTYTVMVDYTDGYYVLLNKKFYEEGENFWLNHKSCGIAHF